MSTQDTTLPPLPDLPTGAVMNGRTHIDRLEATGLECEAGTLGNCADWHELKRCFEFLAEWVDRAAIAAQAQQPIKLRGTPRKSDYLGGARFYALMYGLRDDAPGYLPRTREQADQFEPHAWVLSAMMQAFGDGWADGHSAGLELMKQAQQAQGVPAAHMVETPVGADIFIHGVKVPYFSMGTAYNGARAEFVAAVNAAAPQAEPVQAKGVPEAFPAEIWGLLAEVADRKGTEYTSPWEGPDGEPLQDAADAAIAWILSRAAAPQAEPQQPQQADEALAQTLRNIATTLERQLDLIAERAPGEFLDKRPVVQSLAQHLKRARKALAAYSSGHAQADPQPSIPVHHSNDLTDRVATLRDKLRRDGRTFAVETLDKVLAELDVAHAHDNDRRADTSPEGQAFTGDSPFRAIGGKGGDKP